MATQSVKRQLSQIFATFAGNVDVASIIEAGNRFYIPVVYDDFAAPDLSITGVTATSGASKLTATAGNFDNVRVGDEVTALLAGTLTAKSAVTRTCSTFQGLKYIVYPHTFTSSNLNVKAGDAVTGTGIGSNAIVDRIDYVTRRIFLTVASTATGSETISFTPPVRVTAVRTSTASVDANEVDIDSTVATTGTNTTATIKVGARDALSHVLRIEPLDNTTGGRATYGLAVAILDGKDVKGSDAGLNGLVLTTLNYVSVGSYGFDADTFLANARLPKPTTAS